MYPIYSKDNFDEESFHAILDECTRHKEDGRALVFAFIVYDYKSPAIRKILSDSDYFNTLDSTSGRFLTLFYLLPDIQEERKEVRGIDYLTSFPSTKKSFEEHSDFFDQNFEIGYKSKPPYILFFQLEGDKLSQYFAVFLKEKKVEETFIEIQNQIQSAADCLKKIKPEYYGNSKEIFDILENSVQGDNIRRSLKDKLKKIPLYSIVKGILTMGSH